MAPAAFDPGSGAGQRDPVNADGADERTLCRWGGVEGDGFGANAETLGGWAGCEFGRQVEVEGSGVLATAGPDRAIPEQVSEPGGAGLLVEGFGRTGLEQATVGECADMGSVGEEFYRVMGDVEEGEVVVLLEFAKEEAKLTAEGGIEVGEWFVQEEQRGLCDEGSAEGGAGRFAGGEGSGQVLEAMREAESVGHDLNPSDSIGWGDAVEAEWKFELGLQVEVGQETG